MNTLDLEMSTKVNGDGEENDKDTGKNDEVGDCEENIGNGLEEEEGDGVNPFLIL